MPPPFGGCGSSQSGAAAVEASAKALKLALNTYLWDEQRGVFLAYNTSTRTRITAKTHLLGFPLFGGAHVRTSRSRLVSLVFRVSLPPRVSRLSSRHLLRLSSSGTRRQRQWEYVLVPTDGFARRALGGAGGAGSAQARS